MKIFFCAALLLTALSAQAQNEIYVGPTIGETTVPPSNGGSNQFFTTYGLTASYIHDHFSGGLSYAYYNLGTTGTSSFNVGQTDQSIVAEGKFLFLSESIHPYVTLGMGNMLQTVTTQVLQDSEMVKGNFLIGNIGVGLLTRVISDLGLDFSIKYYQFSSNDGALITLSLGYYPILNEDSATRLPQASK